MSVVILQNPTNYTISGTDLLLERERQPAQQHRTARSRSPLKQAALIFCATNVVAGVPGTSGTITVSHTGRYGDLTGKVVALEPSTGFSFDSPAPCAPR